MKRLLNIATIIFQVLFTYAALFSIYILFALLDNDGSGVPHTIGFLIFQPLYGILLATISIILCFIIGLPIRVIQRVNEWWTKKPFIILLAVVAGITCLCLSLSSGYTNTVQFMENGQKNIKQIPNVKLVVSGWFMIAFALLHFYPLPLIKWIKKMLVK